MVLDDLLRVLDDQLAKRLRLKHGSPAAVAQYPPADFANATDRYLEIDTAVIIPVNLLGLVPLHFGNVLGYQRVETDDDVLVRSRLGDHMPGISQKAVDLKVLRYLERLVECFEMFDSIDFECSDGPMDRASTDHIPAMPTEQEFVRRKFGLDDIPVKDAAVFDANVLTMA